MQRQIINATEFHQAIDDQLAAMPPILTPYRETLRRCWRRNLQDHDSIRPACLRKSDPDWAHATKCPLFRFDKSRMIAWDKQLEITCWLDDLAKLALLVETKRPFAEEVQRFLRGLSHFNRGWKALNIALHHLGQRAHTAFLRSRRSDILHDELIVRSGELVGQRCRSLAAVIRLGREAHCCLDRREDYWERVLARSSHIWHLRCQGRLLAIVESDTSGKVKDILGPSNVHIPAAMAQAVVRWLLQAGLDLGQGCGRLLTEYADPCLIPPRIVYIGDKVVCYAEWANAVRIDLGERNVWPDDSGIVALRFDPQASTAAEILAGNDPRIPLMLAGRKLVRRIVAQMAREQVQPSLVQHRLLTLVA